MNIDEQDEQDEQDEGFLHKKLARAMIRFAFADAKEAFCKIRQRDVFPEWPQEAQKHNL